MLPSDKLGSRWIVLRAENIRVLYISKCYMLYLCGFHCSSPLLASPFVLFRYIFFFCYSFVLLGFHVKNPEWETVAHALNAKARLVYTCRTNLIHIHIRLTYFDLKGCSVTEQQVIFTAGGGAFVVSLMWDEALHVTAGSNSSKQD